MYFLARLMHNAHFLPPTKRSVMSAVCPSYLPDLNSTLSPKKNSRNMTARCANFQS